MRILVKTGGDARTHEVLEITDAYYDGNIYEYNDIVKEETADMTLSTDGLYIVLLDCDDDVAIPGMSKETCNMVCKKLLEVGYADLTDYEPYVIIENKY